MNETKPVVVSSEQSLVVFISSVMDHNLQEARDTVCNCLINTEIFVPWAFEYTPASSERVDEGYLRKVKECDFFVWIPEKEISPPVEAEIREAINSKRHILVFPRDCAKRDNLVDEYIDKLKPLTKYRCWKEPSELRKELRLAFRDEIIRSVRNIPRLRNIAYLEETAQASIARCIARLRGAGVPDESAEEMARNPNVGFHGEISIPDNSRNCILIVDQMGAGKSLVAERLLQEAVNLGYSDQLQPAPMFLEARNCMPSLENAVRSNLRDFCNPFLRGVYLVIDNLDGCSGDHSFNIVQQAEVLLRQWPNSVVIITSRPIPAIEPFKERWINMPVLTTEQSGKLIALAAGKESMYFTHNSWTPSILDAIKRPLFALLLGGYFRHSELRALNSKGQLINSLVEKALENNLCDVADSLEALSKLAKLSMEHEGSPVSLNEIGTRPETAKILQETPLVVLEGDKISFTLPILLEWFAALGLSKGFPIPEDICDDAATIDKWFYALIVFFANYSFDQTMPYISLLAEKDPAVCAKIVTEGLAKWSFESATTNMSAVKCGQNIRDTMNCWIKGLGALAPIIGPVNANGKVLPLAIKVKDQFVQTAWYYGSKNVQDVFEISQIGTIEFHSGEWRSAKLSRAGTQSGWPWLWTLDELRNKIKELIEKKRILFNNPACRKEYLWKVAIDFTNKGSRYSDPILLASILKRLDESRGVDKLTLGGRGTYFVQELSNDLMRLKENGIETIESPWPCPDICIESKTKNEYSAEQQLKRTKAILKEALDSYQEIANDLFPKSMVKRMPIAGLLPAKLHGCFRPYTPNTRYFYEPSLAWYLEPLGAGTNQLEIRDFKGDEIYESGLHEELREKARERKWSSYILYGGVHTSGQTPVTDLIYQWLKQDLKSVSWLD